LLFSTYAQIHLADMTAEQLEEYDRLLDENDWDLYYWTAGEKPTPDRWLSSRVLADLKIHFRNESKKILTMPALDK
jgi:succinate dehydrogenase assembly factor 2